MEVKQMYLWFEWIFKTLVERVSQEFVATLVKKSKYDEALYYYHSRGKCHSVLGLHVDDFMYGGTKFHDEQVIDKFRKHINCW